MFKNEMKELMMIKEASPDKEMGSPEETKKHGLIDLANAEKTTADNTTSKATDKRQKSVAMHSGDTIFSATLKIEGSKNTEEEVKVTGKELQPLAQTLPTALDSVLIEKEVKVVKVDSAKDPRLAQA